MDMEPISYSLKDVLVRQGIARGLAGTRSRGTKVASAPLIGEEDDGPERSPTTRREIRVELNSGEKAGSMKPPASRQELVKLNRPGGSVGFAYVVHVNHAVPTSTRKRTARVPFLVLVK